MCISCIIPWDRNCSLWSVDHLFWWTLWNWNTKIVNGNTNYQLSFINQIMLMVQDCTTVYANSGNQQDSNHVITVDVLVRCNSNKLSYKNYYVTQTVGRRFHTCAETDLWLVSCLAALWINNEQRHAITKWLGPSQHIYDRNRPVLADFLHAS